jgi:hypothetical protein
MRVLCVQIVLISFFALATTPAVAQLRLPGKAKPAETETETETDGATSADVLVGQVVGGFNSVASTFERAARASMKSNQSLLSALGLVDQANELKQQMANLKAIEDPKERQAKMTEMLSDPAIQKALTSASKDIVELSESSRKDVSDAHLLNLRAGLTFTGLISDTVQLTSAVVQLGLGLTNPATVAALDKAGKGDDWFKSTLKPSLKAIEKGAKAFDGSAKKNGSFMKDLLDRFEIEPPSPAAITPIDESSGFDN